jgi:hypothetical protein
MRSGAVLILLLAAVPGSGAPVAVYDAGAPAGREVVTAPANGRKLVVRTAGFAEDAYLLALSGDGRRIAVMLLEPPLGTRGSLLLGRARGGAFLDATGDLVGRPLATAFSPDGRALFFEHRDEGTARSDLYMLETSGRRRMVLTAGLGGTASGAGGVTALAAGPGGRLAFFFELPDRRALFLFADGALRDLTAPLGAGVVHEHFAFLADGALLFRFTPEGDALPTLFVHDGATVPVAGEVQSFATSGDAFATLRPAGLRVWDGDGARDLGAGETVLGFRLDHGRVAFVTAGGGGARVFRETATGTIEVLDDRSIESVESLRFAGEALVVTTREAGARRTWHVGPVGAVEPAAGLPGELGAFLGVAPGGDLLVFARLDPGGASGSLLAWSPDGGPLHDLSAALDHPTVPGEAVFSPSGNEVLYTLRVGPAREPRLFLWRRRPDRTTALSLPGLTVGRFLLAR